VISCRPDDQIVIQVEFLFLDILVLKMVFYSFLSGVLIVISNAIFRTFG